MHDVGDTIVAPATPPGSAARSIVRTSGPEAIHHLCARLSRLEGAEQESGRGVCPALREGEQKRGAGSAATTCGPERLEAQPAAGTHAIQLQIDGLDVSATVFVFREPRSHTGEEIVEYHLPGGDLLTRLLVDDLIARGCRLAEPGEFSARAYLNGKLRLDEAEAVQATIAARSDVELQAARRLRAGELATRLAPSLDAVATLLARCEAGIDFTEEEDVIVLPADEAIAAIDGIQRDLANLLASASRFEQLARLPTIALVGRPNAGKSTLMNALAGRQRAVVNAARGTTRDVVAQELHLPSGTVRLIDCAGLGEFALDAIDAAAQQAAAEQAEAADVLVLLRAADDDRADPDLPRRPDLRVTSKIDLFADGQHGVSGKTGAGLEWFRNTLSRLAVQSRDGSGVVLNARHVAAIRESHDRLAAARDGFESGSGEELAAMDLRAALNALGSVLGDVTPDDILGRVFSTFCVGK